MIRGLNKKGSYTWINPSLATINLDVWMGKIQPFDDSGLYRVQGYLIIEFLGLNNRGRDIERG